jgi:hypothetical protein
MTAAALLTLIETYGPSVVGLVAKLVADVKAGRGQTELTDADWAELNRLCGLSSASIYAKEGVTLPPAAP